MSALTSRRPEIVDAGAADKVVEHLDKIPVWEEVSKEYKANKERIQLSNYQRDLKLRKLKPSL